MLLGTGLTGFTDPIGVTGMLTCDAGFINEIFAGTGTFGKSAASIGRHVVGR